MSIEIEKISQCLKALSDPKRMLLLDLIRSGIQCNCEFAELLDIPANLISHHLRILRKAGLVKIERDPEDARWIYYTINLEMYRDLHDHLEIFFDTSRIQPRQLTCGPSVAAKQQKQIKTSN